MSTIAMVAGCLSLGLALSACGGPTSRDGTSAADGTADASDDAAVNDAVYDLRWSSEEGDLGSEAAWDTASRDARPDDRPDADRVDGAEPKVDAFPGDAGEAVPEAGADLPSAETGHDACQPDCAGRECGDDGCGASCGECTQEGWSCQPTTDEGWFARCAPDPTCEYGDECP